MKELFNSKEVCDILSIERSTLRRYEKRGEIKFCGKNNGRKIYTLQNIKDYFDQFPPELWKAVQKRLADYA